MTVQALLALVLLAQAEAATAPPRPPRPLPPQPLEVALVGGESHAWSVVLAAGDYLSVVVDQRGIDGVVEALAPGGETLVEVDSPNGRRGPERLTLVAATAGEYQVVVHSPSAKAPPGRYELRATAPRPATDDDRQRHTAERAQLAAHRAGAGRDAESYRESARLYRQVLAAWRALGEPPREAEVLHRLGTRLRLLGDHSEAAEAQSQARRIFRQLGDRRGEAVAWNQLGLIAWAGGDADTALDAYRAALELWRELGDLSQQARTLNNLGLVGFRSDRLDAALDAYTTAFDIFRRLDDQRRQAIVLHNIGGVHDLRGEPDAALAHYERALAVARDLGDRRFEAEVLHNQGALYLRQGEAREALQRFETALPIFRRLGDHRRQAAVLTNLGVLYRWLRDPEQAVEAIGAALGLGTELGRRPGQVTNLVTLAGLYADLGQRPRALATSRKALELALRLDDPSVEMRALNGLGARLVEEGQPRQALGILGQALELGQPLGRAMQQTRTLLERGRAHLALADHTTARSDFRRALDHSRASGARAQEAESLHLLAGLEMSGGDLQAALGYAESALGLAESLRATLDSDDLRASYFASLHGTYELTVELYARLAERRGDEDLVARAFETAERARARALLDQLRQVRLEPHQDTDRRSTALLRTAAIPLAELQGHHLGDQTLLLEYFLGTRRSFVWSVTTTSIALHELPPAEAIEALVREVHADLADADPRRTARQREALAALGQMLLGPVAAELGDGSPGGDSPAGGPRQLAIVADGALHYVPFAALPLGGQPLVVSHAVAHLPSAAVLGELRRPAAGRPVPTAELAIFADPVFSTDDPRLAERGATPETSIEDEPSEGSSRARESWPRLPWSRHEADAIVATVTGQVPADSVFVATGFASNLEAVTSPSLGSYRMLHFATHGHLDTTRPRDSALVFSQLDTEGRPRDGDLRLDQIYHLELGADLVVLSGCRTALGREILGEGLQSLTRGFLYAGARRVMASLWAVEDQATAELMGRFYHGLFVEHLAPAAALRSAQVSMFQERKFRDPYYWGAFVLQGDWR